MLPNTKYGLAGLAVGVLLGAVGTYFIPSSDKGSAQVAPSTYGGAKTKHNRNHNNKSRKHH